MRSRRYACSSPPRRRALAVRPYAAGADGPPQRRLDPADDRRGGDAVLGERLHLARLAQHPRRIADGVRPGEGPAAANTLTLRRIAMGSPSAAVRERV